MNRKTKPPDLYSQRGAFRNRRNAILADPQEMHAELGRITVMVLPKMCQQILESIISADTLYSRFQNRNDLKIKLVEEELEIINTMMSNGYKHFTIQLCYKILKHEQWVGKPRQNWGNVPLLTDIHISDDIERIRLSTNKIVSMETKSLDKTTFHTLIYELTEIAKRVDDFLKKGVKFVLQIEPTESMTKAEIESTVEEIRRLPVIEVHTFNQGRTNYARLGLVVVDIFQNILREIIRSKMAPEVLDRHIRKQQKKDPAVFYKMTPTELQSLKTMSNRTYDNIDFTTLYKLMRAVLLIDEPTQGWGMQPTNVDVTISDDVERLRFVRNNIIHRIKADINLIKMNNYFSNIVKITQRIDNSLGKLRDRGFAREVLNFQTHCMDPEMVEKYSQALSDIEDIKVKYSVQNVHICYGKTFSNFIQAVQNKTKTSVISISLVLEDINNGEKPRMLNELKTEINSGQVNIEFKQAVSGSLIIYIDILDSNLLSTEHELSHQIYNFLCRALQITGFNMKTENEITVVLINEEDDIEVEFSIEIDNWETYDEEISLRSNTVCQELDENTEIFNTEQKIEPDFGLLVKSVLGSNGKSNIEAVSARLEPGIVAQQSSHVEPVSGTSEVGPITFQQDQSAKKKPKKSNNENEGDVPTILQESDESAQQSAHVEPVSGTSGVGPTTFQQDQSTKMKPMKSNNENEGDVSIIPQECDESGNNPQTSNYSIKPSTPGTPGSTRVHAIATLTPYQNRWRIRARITQKSGIRTWSNSRGEGKLFSVNLLDESGEIRATGFNDAVDKYYEMLEVGKIYFISKGTLKTANKQYSNLSNDYEMTFNADTIVELCNEDVDLPSVKFDFTKINELDSKTPGNTVEAALSMLTEKGTTDIGIDKADDRSKILKFIGDISDKHQKKVFNDCVHGHIYIHPLCVKIIDTPQFQRLRYLKQLGACYFVHPGAAYNRFEHCIGVCHLAGQLARTLKERQPELDITNLDILCVEIAGLCHGLGHGPFSHFFDGKFIPTVRPGVKWKHEDASVMMFDYMLTSNSLKGEFEKYGLTEQDIIFIKEQIVGPPKDNEKKGREEKKEFLYEIVANKRNGIDVDKWDYFARDCHGHGIKNNFDHHRFMKFSRVLKVDGSLQICSEDKEADNLYSMFQIRATIHKRAHQHRHCNAIETMITDAFILAEVKGLIPGKDGKLVKISECIDDPVAYTHLNDSIYHLILLSQDEDLAESRNILQRIERSELYKCVGQTTPVKGKTKEDAKQIEKCIKAYLPPESHDQLNPDDLDVQLDKLDYGMKTENPIDNVRFYNKNDVTKAITLKKEDVSLMLPVVFAEHWIRLYCKKTDKDSLQLAKDCFDKWCEKQDSITP